MKLRLFIFILAAVFVFGLAFISIADDDDDDDDQSDYYSQQYDDDDDEQDTDLADESIALIRGDGLFHCYLLSALPDGTLAQVIVNASDQEELVEKVVDAEEKYVEYEGGELRFMVCGNGDTMCIATPTGTPPSLEDECTGVAADIFQSIELQLRKGRNPQTSEPIWVKKGVPPYFGQ